MKPTRLISIIAALIMMLLPAGTANARVVEAADTVTARNVFVDLPVGVLDLLTRSNRLDMLDYYDVDSIYKVVNTMDGLSYLEKVAPDYLKVVLTPVSTLQIKVFDAEKKNPVVMTLYTIGNGDMASDTDVRFYDRNLKQLQRDKFLKLPQLGDFLTISRNDRATYDKLMESIPFPTMEFNTDAGVDNVNVSLTVGSFMDSDALKLLERYRKPVLQMSWTGKKLELDK